MGEDDPDNAYYSYLFHTGIDINESYSSPSSDYAFAITGNRNTDMDDYFDEWLKQGLPLTHLNLYLEFIF